MRQARALFTVHGAGEAELERVREGLDHASGYFRHAIGARLRMKVTPQLTFEIDRVFEKATRVESLLREIATEAHPSAEGGQKAEAEARSGDKNEDGDEDEHEDGKDGEAARE